MLYEGKVIFHFNIKTWNLNVLKYVMNLHQENWKYIICQTYLILDFFKNAYMGIAPTTASRCVVRHMIGGAH